MSYSIKTFTTVLKEFLKELENTFPEEKQIKTVRQRYKILKKTNPRKIVEMYMTGISGDESLLTSNNEEFIFKHSEMIPGLNLKSFWDRCSDNTKASIWKYLNTLYVIGTTIVAIPQNMMEGIEKIAMQCAENMQNQSLNENQMPDMSVLMKSMQSVFANQENGNDLLNMLGSLQDMKNNQAEK